MHHAGIQYGQEHMSANHMSAQQQQQQQQQIHQHQQLQQGQQLQQQFNGSDLSVPGVSTTTSLRQWRKKEAVIEKPLPTDANSKEPIARVAPHAHYPRPSELYPYPSHYPEYGMQYKDMASTPVKYSEIVEPAAHHLTHQVIQKPKEKEFLEMCSMQQTQMKHSYPMMPQYVHKESQMHYIPKEPTFPSPYHMQNYKMQTNQYQRQYTNEFQLALFNERHLQEPQLYQQNMDQRMYQNQRMYRVPNYRPQALNPTYQSFNYKPNVQNPDSYRMHPYQQNMQNYKIPTGLDPIARNISPRRVYPDNMNYRQSPNNYNCNQLEYAQHYQNRRIVPDYTTSKYPQMPDIVPESNAKSSLKQYLENWNDDIPDIQESDDKRLKDNSLYILDSTEIPTENIQQFIHLHVDKLPENIKGYISSNVIKPSPDPLNLTQETVIQDSRNSSPQISVISETKKSEQNTVIVYNNDNKPEATVIKSQKQKLESTEDILNEDLLSEGLNLKSKESLEMLDKALEFDDSQSDELKSLEDEIIEHYNNSVGSTNEEELKNAQEIIGDELMDKAVKTTQDNPKSENQSEIIEEKPKEEDKPIKSETTDIIDDLSIQSELEPKLEESTIKEETSNIIPEYKQETVPINEEKRDPQFDTKSIQTEEKEEQITAPISLESKLIQTESNGEKIIKDGAKIMKNIAMQTDTEKQLKPNSEPSMQYLNLITNDNHLLVQIAGEILEIKVLNSVGKKFISVVSFTDCNIIAENNNNNSLEKSKSYELLPAEDLNLETSVINEIEISGEETEVLDVKIKKDELQECPKLEVKEEKAKIEEKSEVSEVKCEKVNQEVEVPLVDEIFEEANGDVNLVSEEITLKDFESNEEIETVSKDAETVTEDVVNIEKLESNDLSEKDPILNDLSISQSTDNVKKVICMEIEKSKDFVLKELESSSIVKEIVQELQDNVVSSKIETKELTDKETKKRSLESSPTEKVHKKRKLSSSCSSKEPKKISKMEERKSTENKVKYKIPKKRSFSDSVDVKNDSISKPLEAKFFSSKHNFSIIPKRDSPVIKSPIPLNKKLTYLAEPTSIQKSPTKETPVKEIIPVKEPIKVKTKAELKETSPVKPVLKITSKQPDSGKKRLSLEEYKRKRTLSDSEDLKKSATTAIPKTFTPIVKETKELGKSLYGDIKTDFEDTLNRILDSKIREEGLDSVKPNFVCDSAASKQNNTVQEPMTITPADNNNKFVSNTKTNCRLPEVVVPKDKCDVVNNFDVIKPKINEQNELIQSTDSKMDELAKKIDDIFSQTFGKNRQSRTVYKKLNLNLDTLNPFGPNKVREIINLDEISEDLKRNQTRTNQITSERAPQKIDKDLFSLEDSRLESVENRNAITEKPLPSALTTFEESRNKIMKLEERMLRKTVICQFDETKSEQVQSTNELIKDLESTIAEIDESKVTVDSIETPEEAKNSEVEIPKAPERCESDIIESVIDLVEVSESVKSDILDLKLDDFSAITNDGFVVEEVEVPVLRDEVEMEVVKKDEALSSPVNCSIPTCEVDFPTLEMIMCKIPQTEEEMPVLSPQIQKHSRSLSINDISKKLMDMCTKDMYAKEICMKDKPTYIRYDSEDLKLYLKKIPTVSTEVQKQRRQRRKKRFRNLHSAESEPEDSASIVKDYSVFESKNQKGLPKLIIKRNVSECRDNNLQPVVRLERNPILDHLAKRKRKHS
ncbi:PREDICTED: putative mediator of RNA polymerase II transcription subunit 26 isoform X2 [Nicrophorus vespilloides]|uniref:Mediator of RNA polymerase II transcription subunit 26 isoform X2 n=1 Tax=Nicrophorus vespilloides TaxID=110193 RepID=A0ABM1MSS0_NICVS|nr:PREDICTED: putative mediator of RNA polymerase II transcription subunit 26 isoform X2 [Nicrophorus vespilloides]